MKTLILLALSVALLPSAFAKPYPIVIGINNDGQLKSTRGGTWGALSEKTLRSDLSSPSACYPEGDPSPISEVRLLFTPKAPEKKIRWLLAVLEQYGWKKERLQIEKVETLER